MQKDIDRLGRSIQWIVNSLKALLDREGFLIYPAFSRKLANDVEEGSSSVFDISDDE